MKYYLHDSNSFNDEKITELFIQFGYEGLGLFYTILEKIAAQEKPIKTHVLKSQLKVGKKLERCWLFMEEIELINTNNGETFNKQLLNYSEKYKIKKENNTKRIAEWREKQAIEKNVTCYESVHNVPKVNISKVNINNSIIGNKSEIPILNTNQNFIIPSVSEISNYCLERKNSVDSKKFFDFYQSKGWMIGKNKMKDWQAAVRNWEKSENSKYKHPATDILDTNFKEQLCKF